MSNENGLQKDYDPIIQSIGYAEKLGFDSIFLLCKSLDKQQLKKVAPVVREILSDYGSRKPFEEIPEDTRGGYKSKETFLEARHQADKINLGLVNSFLLNVAGAVGPEKLMKYLNKESKEPTKEEMYYAYAVLRLGQYTSKPVDGLSQRDLELLLSSVDGASKVLEIEQ